MQADAEIAAAQHDWEIILRKPGGSDRDTVQDERGDPLFVDAPRRSVAGDQDHDIGEDPVVCPFLLASNFGIAMLQGVKQQGEILVDRPARRADQECGAIRIAVLPAQGHVLRHESREGVPDATPFRLHWFVELISRLVIQDDCVGNSPPGGEIPSHCLGDTKMTPSMPAESSLCPSHQTNRPMLAPEVKS